jgi:hypothetical protein
VENVYQLWKAPKGVSEVSTQALIDHPHAQFWRFGKISGISEATQWKTLAEGLPGCNI